MNPRLTAHPWNDLTFEGGTLVLRRPRSVYMTCPQVVLVGIGQDFTPRDNGQVACTYRLNAPPDRTWQALLRGFLDYPRAGVLGQSIVEIDSQKLLLVAPPVNFRSRFEILKTAIVQTNEAYAKEREWVIEHVQYLSEKRAMGKRRSAA
jgi:hypothetical protein